jgi:hypothetical protein
MTDTFVAAPSSAVDGLRLSVHEVVRLATRLGVAAPRHLAPLVPLDLEQPTAGEVALAVDRGLLARDVLRLDGGVVLVDPDVAALVTFIASPGLLVRVDVERAGAVSTDVVYAQPDHAVLEHLDGGGVLTYTSMAVTDVLPFVVRRTGLDDRPAPRGGSLRVPLEALAAAGAALAQGRPGDATACLVEAGAAGGAAESYVRALASHVAACGVTTIHRADDVLTSTVNAWSDCGGAGLWLLDQADPAGLVDSDGRRPVELGEAVAQSLATVRPLPGDELLDRVLAGFPHPA